jgi:hypothetical protein
VYINYSKRRNMQWMPVSFLFLTNSISCPFQLTNVFTRLITSNVTTGDPAKRICRVQTDAIWYLGHELLRRHCGEILAHTAAITSVRASLYVSRNEKCQWHNGKIGSHNRTFVFIQSFKYTYNKRITNYCH